MALRSVYSAGRQSWLSRKFRYYTRMDAGLSQDKQRVTQNVEFECKALCQQAVDALNEGAIGLALRLSDRAITLADESKLAGETRRNVRLLTLRCAAVISQAAGSLTEALGYIDRASTVAAIDAPADDVSLHELRLERAHLLADIGRSAEAESCWHSLVAWVAERQGDRLLEFDTRLHYAKFLRGSGRSADASVEMISAFNLLPRIEQHQVKALVEVLIVHAEKLGEEGIFGEAALLSGEACRRLSECPAGNRSDIEDELGDTARLTNGDLLLKAGKIAQARDEYRLILEAWQSELEESDPKVMQVRDTLSTIELEMGRFSSALEYARENLRVSMEAGRDDHERLARGRIAGIFELQGRYRDAYEMVSGYDGGERESGYSPDIEYSTDGLHQEISIEERLEKLDALPMPDRAMSKSRMLADCALESLETDPERALELIGKAQSELDVLAPAVTRLANLTLANIRALAIAHLGGLPKQIEFEERRLADFVKTYGCSREMTRQFQLKDLADLYVQNGDDDKADAVLRDVRAFLELREGKQTLLYGTVLMAIADISSDELEAQELREQGMEIIESLRDQTNFE